MRCQNSVQASREARSAKECGTIGEPFALDRGDASLLDGDETAVGADLQQERRVEILAAPHQRGVGVHLVGQLLDHSAAVAACRAGVSAKPL